MEVVAIIAAGGRGTRLGEATPKQLLDLGGRPVLEHSVRAFAACPRVREVVVVLPPELAANPPSFLRGMSKPLHVVAGGARRQDSVSAGFARVSETADVVLVHDAARPFVTRAVIDRTIDAAAAAGASAAALVSHDTVKEIDPHAPAHTVRRTLPREHIYLAQTPQGFRRAVLLDAIAFGEAGLEATDEAMLAERAGYTVRLVEGDARNLKITTAADLELARRLVDESAPPALRVGTGYDLHRLVEGRRLVLAGVTLPFDRGAEAHSDGDGVCHAVTDAILGAAALGDIGRMFPDSDPRWKDADSLALLRTAVASLHEAGFAVHNADVVVILERPKLGPHLDAMRARLAEALGVDAGAVSIKGKTSEGVGEIGRGEAFAVHAVVTVRRGGAPAGRGGI